MASCQLWQPLALIFLAVFALPANTSGDHPNLFVRKESFLGLVVPDCPDWQCEGRCDSVFTLTSITRFGCQCDNKCVLYGDCCYDFYFSCRGLPDDEIQDIIHKSRKRAYESVKLQILPVHQEINDAAEYQRCVPGITNPSTTKTKGLYLTAICPETWSNNRTRELCETSSEHILNTIPVTDSNSNRYSYRNIHCALCHGLSLHSVYFWNTTLNCDKAYDMNDLLTVEWIAEQISSGSCIMNSFPPLNEIALQDFRPCSPNSNASSIGCGQDTKDVPLNNPENWYIMIVNDPNGTVFNNPHKAENCLGHSGTLSCEKLKNDSFEIPPVSTAIKAKLIVHELKNTLMPLIKTEKGIHFIKSPQCRRDKVYDYFTGLCAPRDCPLGWYGHDRDCLPVEVSQYPTNYITLPGDIGLAVFHLTFSVATYSTECEDIWAQKTVIRVMNMITHVPGLLIEKGCSKSFVLAKVDRTEALGTRFNETGGGHEATKSDKKRSTKRSRRQIVNKAMADSKPIVSSKEMMSRNKDTVNIETTTEVGISRDFKDKFINMVGISSPKRQYVHIKLKIQNFDLEQLSELLFLMGVEIKEAQNNPGQNSFHLISVEFFNFNSTPTCERLEIKKNLQMYHRQDVLHGINLAEQKQLPLDNVPFRVSFQLNEEGKLINSTSAFLCRRLPLVSHPTNPTNPTNPTPLDCSNPQYYDKHDFVTTNNSLFVYSNKKTYEKGTFQIKGSSVWVCDVANTTNVTHSATVHRGFFTMPYTQYIVVMVCCCLSLTCLLATFVTYICFAQLRDISGIILMCLTVSLFVAQLLFTCGIDQIELKPVCVTIAISLHFLWLSVFSWMNVLTYDIAHKLRLSSEETADKDSKAFKEYCIFAWGVPFLLVGICAALDFAKGSGFEMKYAQDSCWIGSVLASLFGFALPVVLQLLANLTLFSCTIYALQAVARVAQLSEKQKTSRRLLVIYFVLTLIMGLTWGSAYIAALLDIQEMWHAFGALNALQGIFIVCSFVLKTRVVQLYKTRFSKERKIEYPPEEFL